MRSLFAIVIAVLGVAAPMTASAQENRARAAFNAFANTCLAMNADRAQITTALQESGWASATFEDLPRTPAGRHQSGVGVVIEGEARPDSLVFRQADAAPWLFVHVFSGDAGVSCEVYAAGVGAEDLAPVVYPGDRSAERREGFLRLPLAFVRSSGKRFTALIAPISRRSQLAAQRTFAYFSYYPAATTN